MKNKIYTNTVFLLCCFIGLLLTTFTLSYLYKFNILAVNEEDILVKPIINTVIIDPGHGGYDGGATHYNVLEKDINLNISLMVSDMLKLFGYDVLLTRETDTAIAPKKVQDIKKRLELIENSENSVALSIHQNHYGSEKINGAQVFYGTKNEYSKQIAQTLQNQLKLIDLENKRLIKPITKNVYLVYHSTKPTVLIECGFLSNEDEAKKLNSLEYQQKIAFSIATSILLL